MRKIIGLTLIVKLFLLSLAYGIPTLPQPQVAFDKLWVDYDVTENNERGMRIHLKFTTYGMKEMDAYAAIYYLYDDERGGILKDKNNKFTSTTGEVALYKSLKPAYDPAEYKDLQLFMPYVEFDLPAGTYKLIMDIKIIYKQGGVISPLTKYSFEYKKPETGETSLTGRDVKFHDLWIEYDVMDNGRKGMKIHVSGTLIDLKDVDCYLVAYFEKQDGEKIYGVTNEFRSKSGQLAVFKSLKPAYKEAYYKDLILFLPYSEVVLSSGRYNLKLDADIIYTNGDMIKHLTYHDFVFTR